MIYDTLSHIALYQHLHRDLIGAWNVARQLAAGADDGRIDIDGTGSYLVVTSYETTAAEQGLFEAHRRYWDVQILLSGQERVDVVPSDAPDDVLPLKNAYDEQGDAAFFGAPDRYCSLILRPGFFVLFAPSDAHRPSCNVDGPARVKKIVLKLAVDQRWMARRRVTHLLPKPSGLQNTGCTGAQGHPGARWCSGV